MLVLGWLTVLFGVGAMLWADGALAKIESSAGDQPKARAIR
jgi:hypothetical protein